MTRFSQPSFLRGAPRPLVLSVQTQGEQPLDLYEKIASPSQPSFLLESGKGQPVDIGYSFLGSGPVSVVSVPAQSAGQPGADPFAPIRQVIGPSGFERSADLPPFFGGAVGYLSYDFARRLETLPSLAIDDLAIPHLQFALYDLVTAVDHRADRMQIMFCPPMERFLGEDRHAPVKAGKDRIAMRARGQDHQGVDIGGRKQPLEVRETVRGGDPVALADDVDETWRQVCDRRDPEPIGETVEERQVDRLGDRPEAEDTDADAIWHGERCS